MIFIRKLLFFFDNPGVGPVVRGEVLLEGGVGLMLLEATNNIILKE